MITLENILDWLGRRKAIIAETQDYTQIAYGKNEAVEMKLTVYGSESNLAVRCSIIALPINCSFELAGEEF